MVSEGSPTRGAAAGIGRRDSARKESRGEDQKVDQIVQVSRHPSEQMRATLTRETAR